MIIASTSIISKPPSSNNTSSNDSNEPFWIYGCETGCDVKFLVGQDHGEVWRLPAHSSVLRNKNGLFEVMFSGRFSQQATIDVPDVDGRAFDNLLRFLYEEPVSIQSVETALGTLYAGHKYHCHGLIRLCVAYLLDNFKDTNILLILKFIQVFNGDYQNAQNMRKEREMAAAAESLMNNQVVTRQDSLHEQLIPSSELNNGPDLQPHNDIHLHYSLNNCIEDECSMLLQECLNYIDNHANIVIHSDEFEDLDLDTLNLILSRDSLNVDNEGVVFTAITKWADKECKRKQLELIGFSKRQLLQDSIFLPRYLTMDLKIFNEGPAKSDLLTNEELYLLRQLITSINPTTTKATTNNLPATIFSLIEYSSSTSIAQHLQSISRPRCPRQPKENLNGKLSLNSRVLSSRIGFPIKTSKSGTSQFRNDNNNSIWSFFKTLRLKTRKLCCRLTARSSPCSSINSSPVHRNANANNPNYANDSIVYGTQDRLNTLRTDGESQTERKPVTTTNSSSICERIVVCFACFLD